jgi:hypothetical protein
MKITIETKTEKTYEIATPSYHKSNWGSSVYYLSEEVVTHVMDELIVSHVAGSLLFNNQAVMVSELPASTKDHFETAFNKAMAKLISLNLKLSHEQPQL